MLKIMRTKILLISILISLLLIIIFIFLLLEGKENFNFKTNKLNINTVIYYWNFHSSPEGLENVKKILEELNPDMIWYAHWISGFPMPMNPEHAYKIMKSCGFSDKIAEKFKTWVENQGYSLKHIKEQVALVGNRIYCPCILGYSNFRTDFNFDPVSFRCYSKEEIKEMLLNFGKWRIINPKTGKPYTLEETQEIFKKYYSKAFNEDNINNRGVFDLSSKKLIEYQVNKAAALKKVGVNCVWYDLFFQLPYRLAKVYGYDHPMIKDLYNGACEIIDRTKKLGLIVGTWITALEFPYKRVPKVDFVTASPSTKEVLSLKLNYSRWLKIANLIKRKRPGIPLIIIFDFGNRDNRPLAVFSQRLTPEQQSKFLVELYKLAKWLENKTGVKVLVAYPIHGPGLGKNPKKLAWGKYKYYDALAPEFKTYETIKELILREKKEKG